MDKHFQDHLKLKLSESAWVQTAHYMGYCIMALPAGWLTRQLGYRGGILTGLGIVALGCFAFVPATYLAQFWPFLLAVCILSAGLTFLETIANPYTTVLGPKEYATARINLAQSCNGVGWIMGPTFGGLFFYHKGGAAVAAQHLYIPYMIVAAGVVVIAIAFICTHLPDLDTEDEYKQDTEQTESSWQTVVALWSRFPHFGFGVAAQFFYVAAQAGIFAFFINYIVREIPPLSNETATGWLFAGITEQHEGVWRFTEGGATQLLSCVGLVLFLLGRFSGSWMLSKLPPARVLGTYGVVNTVMMGLIFCQLGWISTAALFLSFFFMSIMFPTIFALGIYGLGRRAKLASSFLVMAIMGGAVLPKLMGWIGDLYGLPHGYIVPMVCFAVVAAYGFTWQRLTGAEGGVSVNTAKGH